VRPGPEQQVTAADTRENEPVTVTPGAGRAGARPRPGAWEWYVSLWQPARFWPRLLYPVLAAPVAVLAVVLIFPLLLVSLVLIISPLGLWALAGVLRIALAFGSLNRTLGRSLLQVQVENPPKRTEPGPFGWRRHQLRGAGAWRTLGFLVLQLPAAYLSLIVTVLAWVYGLELTSYPFTRRWLSSGSRDSSGQIRHGFSFGSYVLDGPWTIALVALVGIVLLVLAPVLTWLATGLQRKLITGLLSPSRQTRRIRDLEASRAMALEDAAASLRQIERDLHDGVQARLVALTMQLAMIKESLRPAAPDVQPADTAELVDVARNQAKDTLAELRSLARGIHPPSLDLGLEAALSTLTATCSVPVRLSVQLSSTPSAAVETILYFSAAELLTNVVRHSGARLASIDVTERDRRIVLRVVDDGRGGAQVGGGSGLTGLIGRAQAVDGELDVDSPSGGPTVVTVTLPGQG
jgi:signal transduction histidine kinase